ncbi:MAG: hypothetical protein DRP55_07770 [Spirochaetes bacterium]|nr:MAG: hypothetical protein DRP55_07770 [Spirochaetota bacterium]
MDKRSILNRFNSWEEVPAAVRAWITIRAKEQGKNPVMVHAGYKAAFARRGNVSRKETKLQSGCASCPFKIRFEKISKIVK